MSASSHTPDFESSKLWFTMEDVAKQLHALGWENTPQNVLDDFYQDLVSLAEREEQNAMPKQLPQHQHRHQQQLHQQQYSSSNKKRSQELHRGPLHPQGLVQEASSTRSNQTRVSNQGGIKRKSVNVGQAQVSSTNDYILDMFDQLEELTVLEKQEKENAAERDHKNFMFDTDVDADSVNYNSELDYPIIPPRQFNKQSTSSFIRPKFKTEPKSDPVVRGRQIRSQQKEFLVPGESSHNRVREHTRRRLRQEKETFTRPRHDYHKNDYVVPTEKKRLPLRWAVREHLAK